MILGLLAVGPHLAAGAFRLAGSNVAAVAGWLTSITRDEHRMVRDYLCDSCTPNGLLWRPFVSLALSSVGRICVIPLQDYLGLDNTCRVNKPSTVGTNWRWRTTEDQLSPSLREQILAVTKRYGRMNWETEHRH